MAVAAGLVAWLSALPAWGAHPDPVRFGAAIETGDIRSAREWLDQGLHPEFMADRIGTGLMIGAWEGNIPMMELFLGRGADINGFNRIGEQALQLAAWKGRLEAVKWLLDNGAQVNRAGKQWGALHYAAFAGHKEVVKLLMERGADVNTRTPNDSTALMLTAREGHEDLARVLLEAGADPRPLNDWGDSALTWAMRYNHLKIAKLVSQPWEFAGAVKAAPESFGAPSRSEPAPPEVAELLRQMRIAQAEGRPVDDLRKALFDAIAAFKTESRAIAAGAGQSGKTKGRGAPGALVITARRQQPGQERVELLPERGQAEVSRPAPAVNVPDILNKIRIAREQGRPVDELRRVLLEALAKYRNDDSADSGDAAR